MPINEDIYDDISDEPDQFGPQVPDELISILKCICYLSTIYPPHREEPILGGLYDHLNSIFENSIGNAYKKLYDIDRTIAQEDIEIIDGFSKEDKTIEDWWRKYRQDIVDSISITEDINIIINEGLRGEFWLSNGTAEQADGDIGDMDHENFAVQAARSDIVDKLELNINTDYYNWDEICSEIINNNPNLDSIIRQLRPGNTTIETASKKLSDYYGISQKTWEVAANCGEDPRIWAARELGWVRLADNNLQMVGVSTSKLIEIADGLFDAYGDDVLDKTFDIEVIYKDSNQSRMYYDVPFSTIESGNLSELRQYGGSVVTEDEYEDLDDEPDKFGLDNNLVTLMNYNYWLETANYQNLDQNKWINNDKYYKMRQEFGSAIIGIWGEQAFYEAWLCFTEHPPSIEEIKQIIFLYKPLKEWFIKNEEIVERLNKIIENMANKQLDEDFDEYENLDDRQEFGYIIPNELMAIIKFIKHYRIIDYRTATLRSIYGNYTVSLAYDKVKDINTNITKEDIELINGLCENSSLRDWWNDYKHLT